MSPWRPPTCPRATRTRSAPPSATSSGETLRICGAQALAEFSDKVDWCRLVWVEMNGGSLDLTCPEESIKNTKGTLTTNAAALYDAMRTRESAGLGLRDERTMVDLLRLKLWELRATTRRSYAGTTAPPSWQTG